MKPKPIIIRHLPAAVQRRQMKIKIKMKIKICLALALALANRQSTRKKESKRIDPANDYEYEYS
jgi:hypothetical protein